MKGQRKLCLVLLMMALAVSWGCSNNSPNGSSSGAADSIKPFLGRWDLTVTTPTRQRPSWIEISEEQGQPKGLMVGFGGHATPPDNLRVEGGKLEFTAPRGTGYSDGTEFEGQLSGDQLSGTATNANGVAWKWTGRRAPTLQRQGTPEWGKSIRLFNGKNFDGWRFSNPKGTPDWKIEKGTMVKDKNSSEIISTSKFQDFKLHVEFNPGPKSNSGVYLRGRYEVQIAADSGELPPNRSMGAVYGFLVPEPAVPPNPGKWQTYDITWVGRTLTVVHDAQTIIDQREIPGITGGALDSDEASPGPIYFQGGEQGRVAFRNVVITPAK
ncbi:MAG TPA: DUF1080 domain-containing protein [Terriglobia bacterium]|nr:DUF1080 domain-containing protein [Terriglobia bacterium]